MQNWQLIHSLYTNSCHKSGFLDQHSTWLWQEDTYSRAEPPITESPGFHKTVQHLHSSVSILLR